MSQNYLIGAVCTHLDEPGLYKDYKLLMTWSQFVANNYTNNEVERLVLPADFDLQEHPIHCSALTELMTEDKSIDPFQRVEFASNILQYLPSLPRTTVGGCTYAEVNGNPYFMLASIPSGENVSVQSGCVAICGISVSDESYSANSLNIPASVKILRNSFNNARFETITVVGNEELNITSCFNFQYYPSTANPIIESISINAANNMLSCCSIGGYENGDSTPTNKPPLSTLYINAKKPWVSVSNTTVNYYPRYLRTVGLGPLTEDVNGVTVANYRLNAGTYGSTYFYPTHIDYSGTQAQ